jgi:hypothetical protein
MSADPIGKSAKDTEKRGAGKEAEADYLGSNGGAPQSN